MPFRIQSKLLSFISVFFAVTASGTPASTLIENTVELDYFLGGEPRSDGDTHSFRVEQILDLSVECIGSPVNADPGESGVLSSYRITNLGNGSDRISITVDNQVRTEDDFNPQLASIWIDNGDGAFQGDGTDTLYSTPQDAPTLASGESLIVFVLNNMPVGALDGDTGDTELRAISLQKVNPLDPPRTKYTASGLGGVDLIVGESGANVADYCTHLILSIVVTLTKTVALHAEFNTDTVVPGAPLTQMIPGAIVTYELLATASGSGTATDLVISDPLPGGVIYHPGNFSLNGTALTEAPDEDAGEYLANEIIARLPDMRDGETHTILFNAKLQ